MATWKFVKECKRCGKLFSGSILKLYCCHECARPVFHKTCEHCGGEFETRCSFSRFCSIQCRQVSYFKLKQSRKALLPKPRVKVLHRTPVKGRQPIDRAYVTHTCSICHKEKRFKGVTLRFRLAQGRYIACRDCLSKGAEVACRKCGKPFTTHNSNKFFCSIACTSRVERKIAVTVKCIKCNSTFELYKYRGSPMTKYPMCPTCALKPVKCEYCRKEFTRLSGVSRFCSDACRTEFYRHRRKGRDLLSASAIALSISTMG